MKKLKEMLINTLGGMSRDQVEKMTDTGCKTLAKALVEAGIVIWIDAENKLKVECVG